YFTQAQPVRQNWAPFVLPFIEQGNLVKGYIITQDWYSATNLPTTQQPLSIFYCPSDRPGAMWTDQSGYVSARANYLVCYGNVLFGVEQLTPGRGVFGCSAIRN